MLHSRDFPLSEEIRERWETIQQIRPDLEMFILEKKEVEKGVLGGNRMYCDLFLYFGDKRCPETGMLKLEEKDREDAREYNGDWSLESLLQFIDSESLKY